ncbi:hypothetical protein Hypma_003744 [Hypsizygus marmoreus]|uniref:CxC6 like cysteine cluster associated with KDZ domain-containing protein n=1 Tax=Hypsizygus marmoreus TaxID=39966 RepID=A0A369J1B8_HYPMA|nr:hypothetical protein Hypma_003744 [Hypsizygus marmoreus]
MRTHIEWQTSFKLCAEDAMNGFFLYSLLLDLSERRGILVLSHDAPSQKDRLQPALDVRNKATEGIGQECYPHACDVCFIVYTDDNGVLRKMHPAVCDGDTIGHPTCNVHDCKVLLTTQHHNFCPLHGHLNSKCAVTICPLKNSPGFRTCENPAHRELEKAYYKRGDAIFQLRLRLKKAGVVVSVDSVPLEMNVRDDEAVIMESTSQGLVEVITCDGKSESGNQKVQAYFGRRRTHNEQLIMWPCGVILSRATFYGSEAVSAVHTFAKATFPTPESTPEFFIFDNNCKLDAHQRSINDTHFTNTGKPVDTFHFKSKHKLTDTHCQRYCNPAAFPELIKNGKWMVNMSICEQTNVWFGGYQAIVRDMEVTRYNFFLDEMIKRRNRYIVSELEVKGNSPWVIPMSAIFPESIKE